MTYKDEVLADNPYYYLSWNGAEESLGENLGYGTGLAHIGGNTSFGYGLYGTGLVNNGSQYRKYTITPSAILNDGSWSIELWYKPATATLSGWQELINLYKPSDSTSNLTLYGCQATEGPSPAFWYKANSSTQVRLSANSIQLNTRWHHLVATCDAGTVRLYLDGVEKNSAAAGNFNFAGGDYDLWINAYGSSSGLENWYGRTDELAMYPSALSASRILAHYNEGTNPSTSGGGTTPATFRGWGIPL
jgi:hypothetical protein